MKVKERNFQIKENKKNFWPTNKRKFFKWIGNDTAWKPGTLVPGDRVS